MLGIPRIRGEATVSHRSSRPQTRTTQPSPSYYQVEIASSLPFVAVENPMKLDVLANLDISENIDRNPRGRIFFQSSITFNNAGPRSAFIAFLPLENDDPGNNPHVHKNTSKSRRFYGERRNSTLWRGGLKRRAGSNNRSFVKLNAVNLAFPFRRLCVCRQRLFVDDEEHPRNFHRINDAGAPFKPR